MPRKLAQRSASFHRSSRGGLKYVAFGVGLIVLFAALAWVLQRQISNSEGIQKPIHDLYPAATVLDSALVGSDDNLNTNLAYKVTRVIDGDTFEIEIPNYGYDRIRIKNIDTPELRGADCDQEKKLAVAATDLARTYLAGKSVRLKVDAKRDPYGRTIAKVTLPDGRDYGNLMLASGLAAPWPNNVNWCR